MLQNEDDEIEQKLGYTFQNKNLLKVAFTHASYAHQYALQSNERLEFLGDSILNFVISSHIYHLGENEGDMTERRKNIVSAKPLEEAILQLDVAKFIKSLDDIHLGEKRISSLYESIIAAIYLDGGLEEAKKFILRTLPLSREGEKNYKGLLQEFLQGKTGKMAVYTLIEKSGQDHAPRFVVEVRAEGKHCRGYGKKRRDAEQMAAKALLECLQK